MTTKNKRDYMRAYAKTHRARLREYKKHWARLRRGSRLPVKLAPLLIRRTEKVIRQRALHEDTTKADIIWLPDARKRLKSKPSYTGKKRCASCTSVLTRKNSDLRKYCNYCKHRFNL